MHSPNIWAEVITKNHYHVAGFLTSDTFLGIYMAKVEVPETTWEASHDTWLSIDDISYVKEISEERAKIISQQNADEYELHSKMTSANTQQAEQKPDSE